MTTEKFTEINFPCLDCLVAAACDKHPNAKPEDYYPLILAFKKWDESKKIYKKGLIECWVNMGNQIIGNIRSDYEGIPDEAKPVFMDLILDIMGMLEYIIHSASWRTGQRHEFDVTEVQRKFDQARGWIKANGRFK